MPKKKLLSIILILISFSFLFLNIYKNFGLILSYPWHYQFINLVLIVMALLPIYLINGISWHLIVRSVGGKVSFYHNFRLWMISNLSRFIPGSFWQYPARIALLANQNENKTLASTAVVIEVIFNLVVGSLIVAISLLLLNFKLQNNVINIVIILLIFLALVIYIFTSKFLINKIARLLAKLLKREIKPVTLESKFIPLIFMSFLLQFILGGLLLLFLSQGVADISFYKLPEFIGIYSASWLLGYITIFAPGGLGVQEVSLVTLLSKFMPIAIASLIAILLRLLIYLSELFTVSVLFLKDRIK